MTQTWGFKMDNMAIKTSLCQTDNKIVFLRPLHPMANSLPARKTTDFGRPGLIGRDKTAG